MSHTLVTFHAHPDDESIATAGTMAKAAADGHRVVLVVATRGELGEVPDGTLKEGEELGQRRVDETYRAAEILGVERVEFLGYRDSGMMGEPTNDDAGTFWQADVEEAADKLAAILEQERADVFTCYDDHGVYGHPDHIQVHRVGILAAEQARVPKVYEATGDRDFFKDLIALSPDDAPLDIDPAFFDDFGSTADMITTRIDVRDHVEKKRAAMRAHASQIQESSFFLSLPDEIFAAAFGTEWFILRGAPPELAETSLFSGLEATNDGRNRPAP